jgi:type II secretory pathway pseudopilin PulG
MNAPRTRHTTAITRAGLVGAGVLAGFTIVEMLMVVAIMALLTVGIAQVFRVTGETVKAGKRISNLNSYAAMVEQQIRADFRNLTRDGFMTIRHRTAGGTAPDFYNENISLAPGDPTPRRRRVDEIVFFVTGDFTTQRDPIFPSRQAKATQARIYIGHGHRKDPAAATYYDRLSLDDPNNTNETPKFGQPGPNRYAADWTLLHHVALLSPPRSTVPVLLPSGLVEPNPIYTGGDPNTAPGEDLDSRIQIALQPAASSIFRYLARVMPSSTHPRFGNAFVVRDESGPQRPQFSSGIVDICATDLTEIRAILLDAQRLDNRGPTDPPFSLNDDLPGGFLSGPDDRAPGSFFYSDIAANVANSTTRVMQQWMREAFPANSDAGERMRYELTPPNYLGNLGTTNGAVYDKDYYRVDQGMLTASNFVPGCTEFIVEWSFGKAYPAGDPQGRDGQLIWHGLARPAGVTPTGQPAYAALPYGDVANSGADLFLMPYRRNNGTTGYWPPLFTEDISSGSTPSFPVNRALLTTNQINVIRQVANPFGPAPANIVEYSYFGYVDPTYRLRSAWTDLDNDGVFDAGEAFEDTDADGNRDATDEPILGNGDMWFDPSVAGEVPDPNEPGTIPAPWPRLIRITLSLADPADPLREQSFQFVVEVPEGPINVQ